MDVTLKIATKTNLAQVYISGSMTFTTEKGLANFVNTARVAQAWLKRQQPTKPEKPT